MKKPKAAKKATAAPAKKIVETPKQGGIDWAENVWKVSWTYIRTVVDTVHEPFIILNQDLCVMAANEMFYKTFQVSVKDTENKKLYDLGDGQWDIPALRKLLEDILPKDTFFRGFEVDHEFSGVGRKIMLLNARRIYQEEESDLKMLKPIILLAIEDITEITNIAKTLAGKTKEYESIMIGRTEELETSITELAGLNKTVTGFNKTIAELTSLIESLKNDVSALKKK